jgi:hypothetical protein
LQPASLFFLQGVLAAMQKSDLEILGSVLGKLLSRYTGTSELPCR